MSDDFRIKLSTELDSDVGKNTQKQLDKIDNLSVKIEKAQLTKEAIASIKKQIEDIQVQLSVGSTPSGGSGGGSGGGSNSGGGTRSRTPSSSTTNFTKLKADVDALISSLNNFSAKHTGFANFKKEIDGVEVSLDSLIKGLNEVGNSKDLAELRSQATALRTAFSGIYDKSVENVSVARINSLSNRIQEFMTKNTAITKSAKTELEGYLRELDGGNISVQKWNQINNALSKTQNQMRTLGKLGKSFSDQFKDAAGQFTQWISITSLIMGTVHQFTQSIGELKEIDDILTEISKTSDMTKQELQELGSTSFASASELGKTATDYLTSVQEMSRSGFYGEQGEEMAKTSLLAQAAGDMTADLANKFLLATNAAYKYEGDAQKLNAVLDGMNSITNRNSVSMVDMAEAMSEAGTVAANYRVSIEDVSAMIGTMEAVTKSGGSEVGNSLKSILINLQNITSSKIVDTLDAANASMTEMVNGVEQLRDPISILRDLAATFTQLDEADPLRAEILTNIGGKFQANKLAALLSNVELFDKMLVDYSEGTGSAMVEAQKSADNWSGSLNKLSNTWNSIVNNIVKSDDAISVINSFNSALQGIEKVTSGIDFTSLSTLGTILGGVLGAKNAGRAKSRPLMNMPAVA